MPTRLIARLDVKPPFVVKPVYFEGLRKVGDPAVLADDYYKQGADEIFYIDIVASLYRRPILFDQVEKVASKLFIPFAVGGGIKSMEDISRLLHSGADKVILNTHVLQEDASLINKAAEKFGSQAVTVHIQAKKLSNGQYVCFSEMAKSISDKDVTSWIQEIQSRGVGEILLSSVDCDGRLNGCNLELINLISEYIKVPLIVGSGIGHVNHIKNLVSKPYISGFAIAAAIHSNKIKFNHLKKELEELENNE